MDGFKRYFYKTEIPVRSINEDQEWGDKDPIQDDGSLQSVADKCFNNGMDAQINSNSDVFNRKTIIVDYYSINNPITNLKLPFTFNDEEIKLNTINTIVFMIILYSDFDNQEERLI